MKSSTQRDIYKPILMPHDKPIEMAEALQPTPKWIHDSAGTSFGRCCCLVSFLLLSITALGAAILFIVFVIKPKKPIFHLHSIQLDSFKLNTTSSKEVYVSSPMASLLFVTQNPNKLGIAYSSSDLGILYGGVPVGVIEVPKFYQPPHGRNVTVPIHASLETLNVTSFFNAAGSLSDNDTRIEIQIIGGIRAQGHILNFPLPRIKVSLDCRIILDYSEITLSKGVNIFRTRKALILSHFPHLTQKCTMALCI